jgi:HD-like signal output (HDOD) protein
LLPDTEQDVLGFTHMEVGEQLLRDWGLPEGLVTVVGAHHWPDRAGDYQFDASLVHIAISLSNGEMNGLGVSEVMTTIHPSVWELTALDQSDLEPMLEEIPDKATEVMNLILSPSQRIHSSSSSCPD